MRTLGALELDDVAMPVPPLVGSRAWVRCVSRSVLVMNGAGVRKDVFEGQEGLLRLWWTRGYTRVRPGDLVTWFSTPDGLAYEAVERAGPGLVT